MKAILLAALLLPCTAMAQQTPTPLPGRTPQPTYDQSTPKPAVRYRPSVGPGWQRFKGATRCEQTDHVLTCDNGYTQRIR